MKGSSFACNCHGIEPAALTPAKPPSDEERQRAAENMDWGQVVCNGGPPCFHLDREHEAGFCGRAERWAGHTHSDKWPEHRFVSLAALLAQVRAEASQEALACQDCREYRAQVSKEADALREENARLRAGLRDILEDAGDGGTINRGLNSVQHAEALLAEPTPEKEGR